MKKLKRILIAVGIGILANNVIAQAQSTVSDAYVRLTTQGNNSALNGVFKVEVSDTTSTSAIEVKLGSADGMSDLISYTFNYDVSSGLPSGYSYSRTDNTFTLNVGDISAADMYFGEIRIQQPNGLWSSAYKFVSN